MEVIVANVDNINFDIEALLEEQVGAQLLPFPGMDSKFTMYYIAKCNAPDGTSINQLYS